MPNSTIEKELKEIELFINKFNIPTVVSRENRKIEVITDNINAVDERMRERFDTENAAYVEVIGEGNVTDLYDIPSKYDHFDVIVFKIKETRSERGLDAKVNNDNKIRKLNNKEIQNIDKQLRESNMDLNGLTKELYEDIQNLKIYDTE